MSQENVERVRRAIAAWNCRDLDGWLADTTPDFEWMPAVAGRVDDVVYRGHAEVREGVSAIWDIWEVFRLDETEVRDLGDSALWLGHVHAKGRHAGVELDSPLGIHLQLRDGKAVRAHAFLSWDDALQAAGLAE